MYGSVKAKESKAAPGRRTPKFSLLFVPEVFQQPARLFCTDSARLVKTAALLDTSRGVSGETSALLIWTSHSTKVSMANEKQSKLPPDCDLNEVAPARILHPGPD